MTSSVHSFSNKTEMLGSLLGSCLFFTGRCRGRGATAPGRGASAPGGELQETPSLWLTAVPRYH